MPHVGRARDVPAPREVRRAREVSREVPAAAWDATRETAAHAGRAAGWGEGVTARDQRRGSARRYRACCAVAPGGRWRRAQHRRG
eukprot:gene30551-48973_t